MLYWAFLFAKNRPYSANSGYIFSWLDSLSEKEGHCHFLVTFLMNVKFRASKDFPQMVDSPLKCNRNEAFCKDCLNCKGLNGLTNDHIVEVSQVTQICPRFQSAGPKKMVLCKAWVANSVAITARRHSWTPNVIKISLFPLISTWKCQKGYDFRILRVTTTTTYLGCSDKHANNDVYDTELQNGHWETYWIRVSPHWILACTIQVDKRGRIRDILIS